MANQPEDSETYHGPTVGEMLNLHTFATEVISRADGPISQRIFDNGNLRQLRGWVTNPESAKQTVDEWDASHERRAEEGQGNLVVYLMAMSLKGEARVTDDEIERLKKWFEGRLDLGA